MSLDDDVRRVSKELSPQEAKLKRLQYYWPWYVKNRPITEKHLEYYRVRGITDEYVIQAGGFSTQDGRESAAVTGNGAVERCGGGHFIPVRDLKGEIVNVIGRLELPRLGEDGKPIKFEAAYGVPGRRLITGVHSDVRLQDPDTPYTIFTEGWTRVAVFDQANKCAFGLSGVTGWNKKRTDILAHDIRVRLELIKKRGFVVIAFDSDARTNDNVMAEVKKFAKALRKAGVAVLVVFPPERVLGEKVGWDDAIARDGIAVFDNAVAQAMKEPEERPPIADSDFHDVAIAFRDDPKTPRLVFHNGEYWAWDAARTQRRQNIVRDFH